MYHGAMKKESKVTIIKSFLKEDRPDTSHAENQEGPYTQRFRHIE